MTKQVEHACDAFNFILLEDEFFGRMVQIKVFIHSISIVEAFMAVLFPITGIPLWYAQQDLDILLVVREVRKDD